MRTNYLVGTGASFFIALGMCLLFVVNTHAGSGVNCRLDWDRDGDVDFDDLYTPLIADGSYYWQWRVLVEAPHLFTQLFPEADTDAVDWHTDGVINDDDLIALTPPYGIWHEWQLYTAPVDPEQPGPLYAYHNWFPESQCLSLANSCAGNCTGQALTCSCTEDCVNNHYDGDPTNDCCEDFCGECKDDYYLLDFDEDGICNHQDDCFGDNLTGNSDGDDLCDSKDICSDPVSPSCPANIFSDGSCREAYSQDPGVCFEFIGDTLSDMVSGEYRTVMEMACDSIGGVFSTAPCDQSNAVGFCTMMAWGPFEQREYYNYTDFDFSTALNRCNIWGSDNLWISL